MSAADTTTNIRIEKVAAVVGARVQGIELDQEPTTAIVELLRHALHEHGVLFFEFGKPIEETEQRAFGRLFGDLEPVYRFTSKAEEDEKKNTKRLAWSDRCGLPAAETVSHQPMAYRWDAPGAATAGGHSDGDRAPATGGRHVVGKHVRCL